MSASPLPTPKRASPKVVLADDHQIVLDGLKGILTADFHLAAAVTDGRALISAVKSCRPDIVVTDISMPNLNGLDASRQIKKFSPRTKIIFLTMHADVDLATEAFRAGASGYVIKQSAGDELVTAIREVLKGRTYVTPRIAGEVLNNLMDGGGAGAAALGRLTARQREVLQLIAEGRTMKEVASILNISTRTVESHKYTMMQNLGVRTTSELIKYAVKRRILPPD